MPDPSTPSGSRPAASRRDWALHVRPRLSSLRLSPTREHEIVEELAQHLEDRWRELVAGGASEADATRLALAEFRDGNLLARYMAPLRQAHVPVAITPGAPGGSVLRGVWQDVRYAMRMLRRQPAFSLGNPDARVGDWRDDGDVQCGQRSGHQAASLSGVRGHRDRWRLGSVRPATHE